MRTKLLAVLLGLLLAPVLLSGCTAQTALSNTLEAGTAVKDYADEITDRREKLRVARYTIQDQLISILQSRTVLSAAGGDIEEAKAWATELEAYIDSIYPDIPALISQIRAIRRAIRGDVEPVASDPGSEFSR